MEKQETETDMENDLYQVSILCKFLVIYPFTCQIVVKFTTANPGRKQEIVHEYHYNPLSASFI